MPETNEEAERNALGAALARWLALGEGGKLSTRATDTALSCVSETFAIDPDDQAEVQAAIMHVTITMLFSIMRAQPLSRTDRFIACGDIGLAGSTPERQIAILVEREHSRGLNVECTLLSQAEADELRGDLGAAVIEYDA